MTLIGENLTFVWQTYFHEYRFIDMSNIIANLEQWAETLEELKSDPFLIIYLNFTNPKARRIVNDYVWNGLFRLNSYAMMNKSNLINWSQDQDHLSLLNPEQLKLQLGKFLLLPAETIECSICMEKRAKRTICPDCGESVCNRCRDTLPQWSNDEGDSTHRECPFCRGHLMTDDQIIHLYNWNEGDANNDDETTSNEDSESDPDHAYLREPTPITLGALGSVADGRNIVNGIDMGRNDRPSISFTFSTPIDQNPNINLFIRNQSGYLLLAQNIDYPSGSGPALVAALTNPHLQTNNRPISVSPVTTPFHPGDASPSHRLLTRTGHLPSVPRTVPPRTFFNQSGPVFDPAHYQVSSQPLNAQLIYGDTRTGREITSYNLLSSQQRQDIENRNSIIVGQTQAVLHDTYTGPGIVNQEVRIPTQVSVSGTVTGPDIVDQEIRIPVIINPEIIVPDPTVQTIDRQHNHIIAQHNQILNLQQEIVTIMMERDDLRINIDVLKTENEQKLVDICQLTVSRHNAMRDLERVMAQKDRLTTSNIRMTSDIDRLTISREDLIRDLAIEIDNKETLERANSILRIENEHIRQNNKDLSHMIQVELEEVIEAQWERMTEDDERRGAPS